MSESAQSPGEHQAGRDTWLDAMVESLEDLLPMLGLDSYERLPVPTPATGLSGGYVAVDSEEYSVILGVLGSLDDLELVVGMMLADGVGLSQEDVIDGVGEMANILAGRTKVQMSHHHPDLAIGLPYFLSGQIESQSGTTIASAATKLGPALLHLVVHQRPQSQDYRERRRLERELKDREARLAAILDTAAEGIITMDSRGRIDSVNPSALELFGYDNLMGESIDRLIPQWDNLVTLDTDKTSLRLNGKQIAGLKRDGSPLQLELSFSSYEYRGGIMLATILRDVTTRQKLERELRQAQKLEAIGQLAAGIAHEINTPTQFVNDSLYFLKDAHTDLAKLLKRYAELRRRATGEGVAELLTAIEQLEEEIDLDYLYENIPLAHERMDDGLRRIAEIVKAMKGFGYQDRDDYSAADLNQAIKNTLTISRNEYKYVANVTTNLGDIPLITCSVGHINQVLLNIIVNAAQAIAEAQSEGGERGEIHVSSSLQDECVVISVRDTGPGIPEEIRERIFDPFFTTKEVGRGTGQGLAISHSIIVEMHGGEITVESEVGRGSSFHLRLPLDRPNAGE